MTTVSQTYTSALNVSITTDDNGNLRGVTKWVSGQDSRHTERFGTPEYVAPRDFKPAPKPLDLSTHEGRVQWLRDHPEAYVTDRDGRRLPAASRINAILGLRTAAAQAHLSLGLKEGKEATEDSSLWPVHPVHGDFRLRSVW